MKTSRKWCRNRIGTNTVPGQGREGAAKVPGDTRGSCPRTDDIPDRRGLTHANFWFWTSVIYERICDASHPFSPGTAGRIWVQSGLSEVFHCAQSHLKGSDC